MKSPTDDLFAAMGPGISSGSRKPFTALDYAGLDDIGWNVASDPVPINDLHATMLHLFGLDHLQLTHRFQGRDFRLTDVAGRIHDRWLA